MCLALCLRTTKILRSARYFFIAAGKEFFSSLESKLSRLQQKKSRQDTWILMFLTSGSLPFQRVVGCTALRPQISLRTNNFGASVNVSTKVCLYRVMI